MAWIVCSYCGYEWESRKEKPKSCPRCKRRLDSPYKTKKPNGGSEMAHPINDKLNQLEGRTPHICSDNTNENGGKQ